MFADMGWILPLLLVLLLSLIIATVRARRADWGHPVVNFLDGLNRLYCRYVHRFRGEYCQLPEVGPAIVAANHVSGLDPLLLAAAVNRPIRFLIAREQYERFGLYWLFRALGCIPVDRDRRPERAMREALRALESGEAIALFPFGGIVVPGAPMRPLKRGVLRLSLHGQAPIHPVCIRGVRASGLVVAAVFVPSRARLVVSAPLTVTQVNETEVHALLTQQLGCIQASDGVEAR